MKTNVKSLNLTAIAALALAAVTNAHAQIACSPAAPNIVNWWPGDGNANDIIGSDNGTLIGGVTFAPGKVGQAFSFDGSTGYVQVPDSPSLDITGSLTLDVWVQLNRVGYQYIMAKGDNFTGALDEYQLIASGTVEFALGDGTNIYELFGKTPLNAGEWYNIAAVYDGSTQIIYVNGTQDAMAAIGNITLYTNPSYPLYIAASGGGDCLAGLIDEVQIYNRALSASEIQAIYNAGLTGAGNCKGLTFSPTTLKFPRRPVGTTSPPETVTATNAFPLPVTVTKTKVKPGSDFAETNTTCATLAPGATCTVGVTFTPTQPGTRTGWLAMVDTEPASPQIVGLIGAATDISLSVTRLSFGSHPVGTTSRALTVTATNVGSTAVNFTGNGIVIEGTDPADFVISANTCGASLAGGASCTVSVEFKPTVQGARTATLAFNDDGGASPQTVLLTGTGT